MKNFFKDESGFINLLGALVIGAIATLIAAGAVPLKKDTIEFEKLKHGKAEYTVNQ